MYFVGRKSDTPSYQLWSYNDITQSASQISNVENYAEYYDILFYDSIRCFMKVYSSHGMEMFFADGTVENTHIIDVNPDGSSYPLSFILLNDTVYFLATTYADGREFFKTGMTGTFVQNAFEI